MVPFAKDAPVIVPLGKAVAGCAISWAGHRLLHRWWRLVGAEGGEPYDQEVRAGRQLGGCPHRCLRPICFPPIGGIPHAPRLRTMAPYETHDSFL